VTNNLRVSAAVPLSRMIH